MSRTFRLLPAVALAAAAAVSTAAPAAATTVCDGIDRATACVRIDGGDYPAVCVSATADPTSATDDVTGGYLCLADQGSGPQVFSCFHVGRSYLLCTR